MNAKTDLEARLLALEARMPLPSDEPPKDDNPPLAALNARCREVDAESRAEKATALGVATDALKTAFLPTEAAKKAVAKMRKPLTAPPSVGTE